MDPVIQDWRDVRPESDEERFTERSDERRKLFEEVRSTGRSTALDPITWAFLQVADLESVRSMIRPRGSWAQLTGRQYPLQQGRIFDALRLWKQKSAAKVMTECSATPAHSSHNDSSSQTPSTVPCPGVTPESASHTRSKRKLGQQEYSVRRSVSVKQSCKQRDRNLCAVSRMGEIDTAHLYPCYAFGGKAGKKAERVAYFWQVLEIFWDPESVEKWRGKIFVDANTPNQGTETVANMISLTATLHRFHTAGAFALRPIRISDDKTQLELEFHWLAREERRPIDKVDLMDEPSSSRNRSSSGKGYGPFIRLEAIPNVPFVQLVSGTRFTLLTDDPVNRPLPDPGLLTLQWHLQRILAMSGAAGWKDFSDDDDDNGYSETVGADVKYWLEDLPAHHHRSQSSSGSESGNSLCER